MSESVSDLGAVAYSTLLSLDSGEIEQLPDMNHLVLSDEMPSNAEADDQKPEVEEASDCNHHSTDARQVLKVRRIHLENHCDAQWNEE